MVCDDTIVALCTPQGPGAIALLRITGHHAISIVDTMASLADGSSLLKSQSHTIHYGTIKDRHDETVDSVLFLLMRAPKTFTGCDTVEITCHNNPFIIDAIIARAIECGARLAQPGEFTKLSVLNKKIDLVQAEAINDLIHANSQEAIKRSLAQIKGSLSFEIEQIEKQLLNALALSEVSFDFLDEENIDFGDQISNIIQLILDKTDRLVSSFEKQKQIRQGIRIALIGSVNVGKSSLFNALIGSHRAIVTDKAGTTRDSIEAGMYQEGLYWTLIDTAGLRNTRNHIEQEGIKRSFKEADLADIILLVEDGSRKHTPEEQVVYDDLLKKHTAKIISIQSKKDLFPQSHPSHIMSVSIHDHSSISQLKNAIQVKIDLLLNTQTSPYLLTRRQLGLLTSTHQKCLEIKGLLEGKRNFELVSIHLQDALADLTEITGKSVSEQAMDAVFREFCVGK